MAIGIQRKFCWHWVLANALGFAVPSALVWGLFWAYGFFINLILLGPAIGLAQWIALRKKFRRAGWWVLVTTAGWFFGWFVLFFLASLGFSGGVGFYLLPAIVGASIGLAQCLLFPQRSSRTVAWWILATTASSILCTVTYYLLSGVMIWSFERGILGAVGQGVIYAIVGAIYGGITGYPLTKFFKENREI
jgi:hypothetical protein